MSLSPSAQRAVEWLEQQLADLAGIRNATPRDPSFKNWRQASLTTLQRIWPGDQDRSERFRRIPFSPVDPRADARAVREWYSRGCQEATRVLNSFIEDVRQNGVPDQPAEEPVAAAAGGFEDDFPTVDLPAGDLSAVVNEPATVQNTLSEFVDDTPHAPPADAPAPPSLPSEIPAISNPVAEVHAHDARHPRKGVGARLKDLLGFAQLSAKALAGFPPRDAAPASSLPSLDAPVSSSLPSMDVMPLGGAVTNAAGRAPDSPPAPLVTHAEEDELRHAPPADEPVPSAPPTLSVTLPDAASVQPGASMSGLWPVSRPAEAVTPPAAAAPPASTPAAAAPPPPVASTPAAAAPPPPVESTPPHEPGKSVVMSRPTTLRSAIEKVSIESLLSDQFRSPADEAPGAVVPAADSPEALERMVNDMLSAEASAAATEPATPVVPEPAAPTQAAAEPAPEVPVIPLFEQVRTAPAPRASAPAAPPAPEAAPGPAPVEPAPAADEAAAVTEAEAAPAPPARPAGRGSRLVQLPPRRRSPEAEEAAAESADDSPVGKVDPDAFARAADDFMHSSPVLGATGRKVKRPNHEETGFSDPDAIAVASMMQELARLDVPAGRQPEVRARLLDLARRIEKGDLEWASLRKAVWFAMEYPEIARRLMPVLLPWIDRAA